MRSLNFPKRLRVRAAALLVGAAMAACAKLDLTNPNAPSSGSFWKSENDALQGVNAVYSGLILLGNYGRWQAFNFDIRSDIGTAQLSPWGDLAAYNQFKLNNYDFEINRHTWQHHYQTISRANLVIANVPGIQMDAARRARLVGEAKFLRALMYYDLVTLYENIPLLTVPPLPTDRPGNAAPADVYAQIDKDLTDAAAALPASYGGADAGRATKGAALALLGKARLQQRNWATASAALAQVISGNQYSLLANYGDNFLNSTRNNAESVFEVQMGSDATLSQGVAGLSFPKMIGPCYRASNQTPFNNYDPTFCDGRPTRWYLDQFLASTTATGGQDPRVESTLLFNHPSTEQIYGRPYGFFFRDDPSTTTVREDTIIFFRKYGETYIPTDQRWDNPTNYKVIRYADVLLMQAEALNEQGQPTQAAAYVNQVRQRVGKSTLAGLSQAQMRDSIKYERLLELGLEGQRFNDLKRWNELSPALATRDPDFRSFVTGKSERLPIPITEINLNPSLKQNPGW